MVWCLMFSGSSISGSGNLTFGVGSTAIDDSVTVAVENTFVSGSLNVSGSVTFAKSFRCGGAINLRAGGSVTFTGSFTAAALTAAADDPLISAGSGAVITFASVAVLSGRISGGEVRAIGSSVIVDGKLTVGGGAVLSSGGFTGIGSGSNVLSVQTCHIAAGFGLSDLKLST